MDKAHGMTPRKIAVIGGECTGKTVLCQALADTLPALWVPEYLREFVDRTARAPRRDEQALILDAQRAREDEAVARAVAEGIAWVACDSAPIATALYSRMYFDDAGLDELALRHHASYALTLLADTDLTWEPDGVQRDGPVVRADFDARVRAWLARHGVPFAIVSGAGASRVESALAALRGIQSAAR